MEEEEIKEALRERFTPQGVNIEQRIKEGIILFFEDMNSAEKMAKEMHSYFYPCYEDIIDEVTGHKKTIHAGFCVPK